MSFFSSLLAYSNPFNRWRGMNFNLGMSPMFPSIEQNMFCSSSPSLFWQGGAASPFQYGIYSVWDQKIADNFDNYLKATTATKSSTKTETETETNTETETETTGTENEVEQNNSSEETTTTDKGSETENSEPNEVTDDTIKTKPQKVKQKSTKKATIKPDDKNTTKTSNEKTDDGYTEVAHNPNYALTTFNGTCNAAYLGKPKTKAKNSLGGYDYYDETGVLTKRSDKDGNIQNIKATWNKKVPERVKTHPDGATVGKNGYYYVKDKNTGKVTFHDPYGNPMSPETFKAKCKTMYRNAVGKKYTNQRGYYYIKTLDGETTYYDPKGRKMEPGDWSKAQQQTKQPAKIYERTSIM